MRLALIFCLLLQACGATKLTYNNADTLLYWWLDGYVDGSLNQQDRFQCQMV